MTWSEVAMWAVLMGWGSLCLSFVCSSVLSGLGKGDGNDS